MNKGVFGVIGIVGAAIAAFFGGWDSGLITLVIFMAIDFVSGLVVAGIFKKSTKSESGALESHAGWKGLCKKCMTLLFVGIAHRLDMLMGTNYLRDAVTISFCSIELLSIVESAGIMGIPIPKPIMDAIEVLRNKENPYE